MKASRVVSVALSLVALIGCGGVDDERQCYTGEDGKTACVLGEAKEGMGCYREDPTTMACSAELGRTEQAVSYVPPITQTKCMPSPNGEGEVCTGNGGTACCSTWEGLAFLGCALNPFSAYCVYLYLKCTCQFE